MSIQVKWDNDEKTIVRYEIVGKWTWDDLYPEYNRAIEMEKSVDHRVDIIIDMLQSASLPISALTHMRSIAGKQPDNVGLTVLVTENRAIRTMFHVGTTIDRNIAHYFSVATSLEEAYTQIANAIDAQP